MKIDQEEYLINDGNLKAANDVAIVLEEIRAGIKLVTWNSEHEFIINPTIKGNGVVPIKQKLITHLEECGWQKEVRLPLVNGLGSGPIDAVKELRDGKFALEWETGNIASSHRSLNRLALGILQRHIFGGALILPNRNLYQYLTDRIGNFQELQPYFPIWRNLKMNEGVLLVISIEHDGIKRDVALIPKGKDGNARKEKLIS